MSQIHERTAKFSIYIHVVTESPLTAHSLTALSSISQIKACSGYNIPHLTMNVMWLWAKLLQHQIFGPPLCSYFCCWFGILTTRQTDLVWHKNENLTHHLHQHKTTMSITANVSQFVELQHKIWPFKNKMIWDTLLLPLPKKAYYEMKTPITHFN